MKKFLREVHRRSMWQILGIYAVSTWIVFQVAQTLTEGMGLPAWVPPLALILLLVGLPIVLMTAFVQKGVGGGRSPPPVRPFADADEGDVAAETPPARATPAPETGVEHRIFTWRNALIGGAGAFLLLFGFAGLYVVIQDRGQTFAPEEAIASDDAAPAIAVLPFSIRGEGLDVWREGMVDALSTNLDGAGGFRTIASRTVLAQWSEVASDDEEPDQQNALAVAQATGARFALTGNMIATGENVRLTAEAYDSRTGESVGRGQAEGHRDSVFALVDALTMDVLRSLLSDNPTDPTSVDLARITTSSLPALRSYLEGESLWRSGDYEAALSAYRRATEQDSAFAMAYFRMSEAQGWVSGTGAPLTREAVDLAYEHVDGLPERQKLVITARHGRYHTAGPRARLALLRDASRRYPDDPEIWYELGELYYHGDGPRLGMTLEDAESAFARAVELDPVTPAYRAHWAEISLIRRPDSAQATARIASYAAAAPGTEETVRMQQALAIGTGDSASREAAIDALISEGAGAVNQFLNNELKHPRHSLALTEIRERHFATLPPSEADWGLFGVWFSGALSTGRLEHLRQYVPPDPRTRAYSEWLAWSYGLRSPEGVADSIAAHLELPADDRGSGGGPRSSLFALGTTAVEQGRWDDHRAAIENSRKRSAIRLAEGDTMPSRRLESDARALEGYGAWKQGDLETAAEAFEDALEYGFGFARLWLAHLNLEMDRPSEAARLFSTFWWVDLTPAYYWQGKAYEAAGDNRRAAEAYQAFVEGFYEADDHLQPMVEEARQAIVRLRDAPPGDPPAEPAADDAESDSDADEPVSGDRR